MLREILWVALGGGIGSALRYLLSTAVERLAPGAFPAGTLAVNLLGCLAIGVSWGALDRYCPGNSALRLLVITGVCGGFTTFSTFSRENFTLLQSGRPGAALLYTVASVLGGVCLTWGGWTLVNNR